MLDLALQIKKKIDQRLPFDMKKKTVAMIWKFIIGVDIFHAIKICVTVKYRRTKHEVIWTQKNFSSEYTGDDQETNNHSCISEVHIFPESNKINLFIY